MLAATISLVGHDCLFRGQETFSGIQVKDVKWNLDQRIVTLHIGSPQEPGKVAQDGSGYDVHIGDYSVRVAISVINADSMFICYGVGSFCISFLVCSKQVPLTRLK